MHCPKPVIGFVIRETDTCSEVQVAGGEKECKASQPGNSWCHRTMRREKRLSDSSMR